MKRIVYLLIILALILGGTSISSYGMTDQSTAGQQSQKKVMTGTKKVSKPRKKRRVRRKKRARRRVRPRARTPQKVAVQEVAVKVDNNSKADNNQKVNNSPRVENYLLLEYYQMMAEYNRTKADSSQMKLDSNLQADNDQMKADSNQQMLFNDYVQVESVPQEVEKPLEIPVEKPVETPVVTPVVTSSGEKKARIEMKRMRSLEQNLSSMKTTPVENIKAMEAPSSKEKSDEGLPVIMFAANSNLVSQNQMDKMAELANYLRNHPRTKLCIKGKAPRVNAVRNSLIGRYGIISDRLTVENDANATAVTFVVK